MRTGIEKTLLNKIADIQSLKSIVNGWQVEGKKGGIYQWCV